MDTFFVFFSEQFVIPTDGLLDCQSRYVQKILFIFYDNGIVIYQEVNPMILILSHLFCESYQAPDRFIPQYVDTSPWQSYVGEFLDNF